MCFQKKTQQRRFGWGPIAPFLICYCHPLFILLSLWQIEKLIMKSALVGVGKTALGKLDSANVSTLLEEALNKALVDAGIKKNELEGLVLCPALADPQFMAAHRLAQKLDIYRNLKFCTILDTGGASPVSGLILAKRLIESGILETAAVLAGDAIASLGTDELLARAGRSINHPDFQDFTKPVIPLLYNLVAEWHIKKYGTTREQLAMVPVLMSRQALRHPAAMNQKELTVEKVLSSKQVASVTNVLECARPADGAGALILVAENLARGLRQKPVFVISGGEGVGPVHLPSEISEDMFSAKRAVSLALAEAEISKIHSIDYFGIYDCFPICFIKFLEDAGVAMKGHGGYWVECMHNFTSENSPYKYRLPVNTHGGLLSFGAPWEAPAIFSIVEAVEQMRGLAGERQLGNVSTSLIYGNGGVFSSSAVAILSL